MKIKGEMAEGSMLNRLEEVEKTLPNFAATGNFLVAHSYASPAFDGLHPRRNEAKEIKRKGGKGPMTNDECQMTKE